MKYYQLIKNYLKTFTLQLFYFGAGDFRSSKAVGAGQAEN